MTISIIIITWPGVKSGLPKSTSWSGCASSVDEMTSGLLMPAVSVITAFEAISMRCKGANASWR